MNSKLKKEQKFLFDISSPKEILISILIGGALLAGTAYPALIAPAIFLAKFKKDKKRKFQKSFYYLKKNGLISVESRKGSIIVALTKKGKKVAQRHKITTHIEKSPTPSSWDEKWRIIIFDIPSSKRFVRDALRQMIKKIGMVKLQKSVWLYPFDCSKEIKFIKDFFSLKDQELRVILATDIGDDAYLRKIFKI